ncbi:MAG: magnesium transporter, partial [Pseudomonadota bacterium]
MAEADLIEEQDGYELDDRLLPDVRKAVADDDRPRLDALLEPLHPADIADLLEQMDSGQRRNLLRLAADIVDGEVLSEISDGLREEIIEFLPAEVLSEAVRDLESDDVVDIVEDLDEPQQEAILDALDIGDRYAVEQALSYPEESAGRLMQREVVMGPEHWTVGQAIDYLRATE